MNHFSNSSLTYIDAALGWAFDVTAFVDASKTRGTSEMPLFDN
jgi:hypothetical protein